LVYSMKCSMACSVKCTMNHHILQERPYIFMGVVLPRSS
jgi:hypothetical protein